MWCATPFLLQEQSLGDTTTSFPLLPACATMFKVAVQSAVLSIRQGGDFQYLALVTRTLNSIGQIRCLYHGADAANLTFLGKPPGILVDGLKIYKRGLVAVYAMTIPASLFTVPDGPLSQHVPALTLFSAPDGVATFTLYHHSTAPIAATEPPTKLVEASLKMKVLPPRLARLLRLHNRTVLGKRKRQDRDEDTNVSAASLVAMENLEPVAMKENVDPSSGRSLSMVTFHAR
ncbi:hypothetical protein EYR38_010686 [Pleurotus pulmonarius]|nr:hypothetical protein EYR38_010686 [Pleurotus pulmonarius]